MRVGDVIQFRNHESETITAISETFAIAKDAEGVETPYPLKGFENAIDWKINGDREHPDLDGWYTVEKLQHGVTPADKRWGVPTIMAATSLSEAWGYYDANRNVKDVIYLSDDGTWFFVDREGIES